MSAKQGILDAVMLHLHTELDTVQRVQEAWETVEAVYTAVDEILRVNSQRSLSMDLEAAINAYASELVRAAFVAGLAFDGRALLLSAANK